MNQFAGTICVLIIAFTNLTYADEISITTIEPVAPVKTFEFGASLKTSTFEYEEPDLMKQSGRVSGFSLNGTYIYSPDFSVMADFTSLSGDAKYDGAYWSGKPLSSEDSYKISELSAKAIWATELTPVNLTSIYLGLGRRTATDANDPSPTDYFREHVYNYYSAGVNVKIDHNTKSKTIIDIGIKNLMSGTSTSNLSDADPDAPDLKLKFKSGYAFKAGVLHRRILTGNIEAFAALAYENWKLTPSELATFKIGNETVSAREPKNSTTMISIDAGLIF